MTEPSTAGQAHALDLAAYLARIGYAGPEHASLATLAALQALQPAAIPFENLDVLLERPIPLDLRSIEQKLVKDRRGGYCFEQNGLFAAALRALGFRVVPLAARALWQLPSDTETARTHMILQVELDSGAYLADVGFGGLSLTAPLRLDTPDEQPTPHEPHRIVERAGERILQAKIGIRWHDVYGFYMQAQRPIDQQVANWYTSTHPASRFRQNLIVTRAPKGARYIIHNREFTVRRGRTLERNDISSPEALLDILAEQFGLIFPGGTRFDRGALTGLYDDH